MTRQQDISNLYKLVRLHGRTFRDFGLSSYRGRNNRGRTAQELYTEFLRNDVMLSVEDIDSRRLPSFEELRETAERMNYRPSARASQTSLTNWLIRTRNQQRESVKRVLDISNPQMFIDELNEIMRTETSLLMSEIGDLLEHIYRLPHKITLSIDTSGDDRDTIIPVSRANIKFMTNILRHRLLRQNISSVGSDAIEKILDKGIDSITFQIVHETNNNLPRNTELGYFKYINKTHIDLLCYQIFTEEQIMNIKEDEKDCMILQNCVLAAIEVYLCGLGFAGGFPYTSIIAKSLLTQESGRMALRKEEDYMFIANTLKCVVELYKSRWGADGIKNDVLFKTYTPSHIEENRPPLRLAVFKQHVFIYEKTPYSHYYIRNWKDMDADSPPNIGKYRDMISTTNRRCSSLQLVSILFATGGFEEDKCSTIMYKPSTKMSDIVLSSDMLKMNQVLPDEKPKRKTRIIPIYYTADVETDVSSNKLENGSTRHEAILFAIMRMDERMTLRVEPYYNSEHDFLASVRRAVGSTIFDAERDYRKNHQVDKNTVFKHVVYFHNAKYDITVLMNKVYPVRHGVRKDGNIYAMTYAVTHRHVHYTMEIRDSYKLLAMPLSKMPIALGITSIAKREFINYNFHTKYNIDKNVMVSFEEYTKGSNLDPNEMKKYATLHSSRREDGLFDANKWYRHYLEDDVRVLAECLLKFRTLMQELVGFNVLENLTISSVAHRYMTENGCYDNVVGVKGLLDEFISRSIYGGRVYLPDDVQGVELNEDFVDSDVNSLYPSAMVQMSGSPIGPCELGDASTDWFSKDHFVVEIRITAIRKRQRIPSVTLRKDDNTLHYLQDIDEPLVVVVDKIQLGEYIRMQDIEYEIIQGVYWDNGFNTCMPNLVKSLYESRKQYKKEKNGAMDFLLKLLLNSIYGKTIMRAPSTKFAYINQNQSPNYILNHFESIKCYELQGPIDKPFTTCFEVYEKNDSPCFKHVGGLILSVSKRIMNNVLDCANDLNIQSVYTDTDSFQYPARHVQDLAKLYKKRYGEVLFGKELGQLSNDFELDGCKNVKSVGFIGIGRKTYLHILEGVDKDGNVQRGHHIRMKGITKAGIAHVIKEYETPENVFRTLANGQVISIPLNPDSNKPMFDYQDVSVYTRATGSFLRQVKMDKTEN